MHHTGIPNTPPRASQPRYNWLADNRALTQVLTHSDNMGRLPVDIVRDAVCGGVVCAFTDEKNRYDDQVFLPSSCDLTALAFLISEGFFAPFLHRTVGDWFQQYTILTESGFFEPLSIPVLLFPDCFYDASFIDTSLPRVLSPTPSTNGSISSMPSDSISSTAADVLHLHNLRLQVGVLLLKSVNEVLRDAEVWKLKANRQKRGQTPPSDVVVANAVIALFYEVKMLLLCCIISTEQAYPKDGTHKETPFKSARSYFESIFSTKELRRIFEERSRPGAEEVMRWFDSTLGALTSTVSGLFSSLQERLQELLNDVSVDGRRVTGTPVQILHRPHDSTSTNVLQLPFVQSKLPHLPLQTGELATLLSPNPGEMLLCDSVPSPLSLLLRRCATVKMSALELRDGVEQLAMNPWWALHYATSQTVQRQLSDTQFIRSAVGKNSCFLIEIVRWLRDVPSDEAKDVAKEKGSAYSNSEGTKQQNGRTNGESNREQRLLLGLSTSNEIIDHVVHDLPFGTAVAQLIRELVGSNLFTEEQLHRWIGRSLKDVESKPPATIGCFAALLVFVLLHSRWELPADIREMTVQLCSQNKQQQDCVQLINILQRGA
ncbi:hypothetical protein, conserved [Trypanosoma brucei gambiense DAL972]|uniref:Uncharacterized protein n=1 Tax=Trypanosoma brucei gambiense (strain MHOM/CI/86/DAL972) TaxID=679716 RepID=D0A2V1_TRYB9|nr:hypothetical protein, conserved [Trypanosoma brucei gambiense DAL972]CBH15595.1 hypothetical protein, conserved [Trypanosoma brucei gambiense DAL972]|eukprot:XP_011777859.1 hypothetical protein, conserved [Trypanosoma brucei gambiense DAL972]